ncbi:MAG: phosphatase PAP2 family protein [Phaeodactylibacter sp.]|nr:phosphatase PAP2 family protein [Phaeodactylibacter sp.]
MRTKLDLVTFVKKILSDCMRLRWYFFISFCCSFSLLFAQSGTDTTGIYKVNRWVSGGLTAVGIYANIVGLPKVKQKDRLTELELEGLANTNISRFNRSGLTQDPTKREQAHHVSDFFMYGTASLPFLLFLDKKIKKDYLDVGLMYLETVAITSNLYTYSPLGPTFIDRYRPLAFYEEVPLEERQSGNMRNSFYSGHVATTAMGGFFLAKVVYDYHPEWGNKRWLLFGAASLPTATVAWLRVRALKHFPSDVIVGGVIGAGMGILVPELHRKLKNRVKVNAGFGVQGNNLGVIWAF